MQSEELRKYVETIIEQKKLSGVEPDIKQKLVDHLTKRLEDQITRALIDSLSDDQFDAFEKLVNDQDTDKLGTFFADNNVPINDITTTVLAKFRVAYLGS